MTSPPFTPVKKKIPHRHPGPLRGRKELIPFIALWRFKFFVLKPSFSRSLSIHSHVALAQAPLGGWQSMAAILLVTVWQVTPVFGAIILYMLLWQDAENGT